MRRLRRLVMRLTALALLPALAVFLVAVALRTPWVEAEVRTRLATALGEALGARVSIGRLQGTLLAGVRARDVRIVYPTGSRLIADEASATYALPALLAGRVLIGTLRLHGVDVRLVRTADGWRLTPPRNRADRGTSPTVIIRRIVLDDARVAVADLTATTLRRVALTRVHLDAGLHVGPDGVRATIAHLDTVPRGVALSPLTLRGTVAVGPGGRDVRIDALDLATRRSRLTGTAHTAGQRLAVDLLAAPLSARELHAFLPGVGLASDVSGTVTARGPRRRLGVRADLRTAAAGTARLFGTVDTVASPMRWTATARPRGVDLAGIRAGLPSSRITGRVRGHGVAGLTPPMRLRVQLAPSTVAGVGLDETRVLASVAADGLVARGTVAVPAGKAAVDGRLSWGGKQLAGSQLAYQADIRAHVVNLAALLPSVAATGVVTMRVDGRGVTARNRAVTAHATVRDARVMGLPVDEAAADLTLRGSVLQIASGTAATHGITFTAAGTVDLTASTLNGTVGLTGDVVRLAAIRGIDASGKTTAHIAIRGPFRSLAVDTTAVLDGMRLGARTLRRGGVTLALTGLGGDAPAGRATFDADGLAVGGPAPWTGSLAADWRRAQGTDTASVTLQARADDGTRVASRGTVRRIAASGAVDAQLAELTLDVPEQPALRLAGPARVTVSETGTVTAGGVVLAAANQRLRLEGSAGRTGPVDATLVWDDLDLALVCRLRGLACAGRSSGSARVTGTAAAPRLTLGARAAGVTVAGSPVATGALNGDYGDRALRLRGRLDQADAGSLGVTATVPVDLAWEGTRRDVSGTPLAVVLHTDGLDLRVLRLLAPDAIRRSAGRLAADVRVTGLWPAVRADGVIRVTDGELALAATGVTWKDVTLRAVARGDQVLVESITARSGRGTLEGGGTMALVATRTTPFALRLQLRDFLAVSQPGYEAATDGTLVIEGALAYPVVRGDLTLTRLLIRPSVLERESGISVEPDPTIEVVGLPAPPEAAEPRVALSVADALSMDVQVRVVHDAWIRRADADVELRGDLQLGKAAHRPLYVTGELRLVRGWYAFQGRRFTVEDSRLVFGGDVPPDPLLDIKALHRAGEYEITVHITGRATQPVLGLSSVPTLTEADILSTLVFGRPARELGREQGVDLQRQAIALASGYVAPELRQSIMRTLDLDTFEFSDKEVSAGRYVRRDVFVTLASDLTGRAGQTVGVEYNITRRLAVKLSTSTQGNSAIDVLWRRRY